jgi:hypothetical protein
MRLAAVLLACGAGLLTVGSLAHTLGLTRNPTATPKKLAAAAAGAVLVAAGLMRLPQVRAGVFRDAARWWRPGRAFGAGGFAATLAVTTLLLAAYPLGQLLDGGPVCYENAFDERLYLQYDFSRGLQGPARSGQYLVTAGHELGLSGAWVNLLFDLLAPGVFAVLARAALRGSGWRPEPAGAAALALLVLPAAAGTWNPLAARWFDHLHATGGLYWVTAPQAWYLPMMRTPEPQWSLILLAGAAAAAIRLRSWWPAYAVLPVLYPFVAVPAAFVVITLRLSASGGPLAGRTPAAAATAYLIVSAVLAVYFAALAPANTAHILCPSRLPLVSTTGALALAAFVLLARAIPPGLRSAALAVALAPTAAANQQVISGVLAQPNNFEQNFGVVAVPFVLVAAAYPLLRRSGPCVLAAIALTAMIVLHAAWVYEIRRVPPPSAALVEALAEAPATVAINDPDVAGLFCLLHPRQPLSPFAVQGIYATYGRVGDGPFEAYRRARAEVLADPELAERFAACTARLDRRYRHEEADLFLHHIGRRTDFAVLRDPAAPPPPQSDRPRLRVFFVR